MVPGKLITDFFALQIYFNISLKSLVTLFKEKASNIWIQEEIAGFEFQYKSLNFPPSCPDYAWRSYERELLY